MRDDKALTGCTPQALAANWLWGWIVKRLVTVRKVLITEKKPGGRTG